MSWGCCSDVECWPLLPTAFTLFSLLFPLLQSANTSTNIPSTKQCFQILLESCGVTLPFCQKPEPVVHRSAALWPYLSFLLPPVPAADRRSCSCRCKASKNLLQLGSSCAGHPGETGKRRLCQTLCTAAASKLSSEVFWVLLWFLSNRMWAHKWDELEKVLHHLQFFESPVCPFPGRSMGFYGIVVFSWWELWKNSYSSA